MSDEMALVLLGGGFVLAVLLVIGLIRASDRGPHSGGILAGILEAITDLFDD